MLNDNIVVPEFTSDKATEQAMVAQILDNLNLKIGESDCILHSEKDNPVSIVMNSGFSGMCISSNGVYTLKYIKENQSLEVTRATNYVFEVKNKIKRIDFNYPDDFEHGYNVEFVISDKKCTVPFTIDELQNQQKFDKKMIRYGHFISLLNDKQHKALAAKQCAEMEKAPNIIEFKTAGYNIWNGDALFLTVNKCYKYGGNDKIAFSDLKLSKDAILQPKFATLQEILADENIKTILKDENNSPEKLVSCLLLELFNSLKLAYNNRIEPYIVLSVCFMALFLKQISNDFEGTPILALYGEAASGKTNLMRIAANIFGLNKDVLHGGMDTVAGIIEDLENYVNIPLIVDEVELGGVDEVKRLIKSVYGQTSRKKFNCKNNINTTLFFNTNNEFLYDLEYKNRCIRLNFSQGNFNCDEASKFNKFQTYLSYITGYIIEFMSYADIKAIIENEEHSKMLEHVSDNRIKRNLAIAITGFKMLLNLINSPEEINFSHFEERLADYVLESAIVYEDDVDKFITILKELLDEYRGKLKNNVDYKIMDNGIHLLISKRSKTLDIHFKKLHECYYKGSKPLRIKDYQKLLLEKGAEMKNVHYSRDLNTKYGIFLPYEKFEELAYLADRLSPFDNYNSCINNRGIDNGNNDADIKDKKMPF